MTSWVLVTRAAAQCGDLTAALAARGIRVVPYPTLRSSAVEDEDGWKTVRARASAIAWLAFTSAQAPAPFAAQAEARSLATGLRRVPAAAVGRVTAGAATQAGCRVVLTGDAGAESLARQLVGLARPRQVVLHPRGRDARPELEETLAGAGLEVLRLIVYATEIVPPDQLPQLPEGDPVAVVLSSPRATLGYARACGRRYASALHLAFGPTTAEAALGVGFSAAVLREPSDACVLEELCPTS